MARDHYIPMVLTKPWEHMHNGNERQLSCFDFASGALKVVPARKLFSKDELNLPEVERMLRDVIDTPIGEYLLRPRKEGIALEPPMTRAQNRALRLLAGFHIQRLSESRGQSAPMTLVAIQQGGEQVLNQLAQALQGAYRMYIATLPQDQELFFTEVAAFPVPFESGPPAFAIPLGLRHVVLYHEGDVTDEKTLAAYLNVGLFEQLSIGVGSQINCVVLPPGLRTLMASDPVGAEAQLRQRRAVARGVIRTLTGIEPD